MHVMLLSVVLVGAVVPEDHADTSKRDVVGVIGRPNQRIALIVIQKSNPLADIDVDATEAG
jgi:hypothetical protein